MKHSARRWMLWLCLIAAMGVVASGCSPREASTDHKTIVIGWTAWNDDEFVSQLARTLIEQRTGHQVELRLAAISQQYQSVADGRMDVMMMAWLPDTHSQYWQQAKDRVIDLGALYHAGELGWVVPDYVPTDVLASIADLHKPPVAKRLKGRIRGIDPGAGLMQSSARALDAYDLQTQYRLIDGDSTGMLQALEQAIAERRWIVVTGWTPHWMFARFDLRYLDDPKAVFGTAQHVDVVAREGFAEDYPQVAAMLGRMHIPLPVLESALLDAQDVGYHKAVRRFIDSHPALIDQWFAGSDLSSPKDADNG